MGSKRRGLRGVDKHGDLQFPALRPDGVELGVVEMQAAPIGLLDAEAELLEDLEPESARLDVLLLELGRRPAQLADLAGSRTPNRTMWSG